MIPIVERVHPRASEDQVSAIYDFARMLRGERADLAPRSELLPLIPDRFEDARAVHLDDQSAISVKDLPYDSSYVQDRARLRAEEGDLVCSGSGVPPVYETYCREWLGMGDVTWLVPSAEHHRRKLASHCWQDRAIRHALVHGLRSREWLYLHPLMGSSDVWELARMLQESARRPLKVIAPPPELTQWVNDKLAFADTVRRLFGPEWIPATGACSNFALLSHDVRELAERSQVIGLKIPDAAGGGGNLLLDAAGFRGRSLLAIRRDLKIRLRRIGWRGERTLLVGSWETNVVSAPSAQLWIPPPAYGPPVVEGVFEQALEGSDYEFVGCQPAALPADLTEELVTRSWLLGLLYQELGYIGRCSFDAVVVGKRLEAGRLELIECNGRWGGTSLPMTLMNRLVPERARTAYVVRSFSIPGLYRFGLEAVLELLGPDLFDVRTGSGRIILFNPARISVRSGLSVILLGKDADSAARFANEEFPEKLSAWVASRTGDAAQLGIG